MYTAEENSFPVAENPHTVRLLRVFLTMYTDAAAHLPLTLISLFREGFVSPNTPFLPEEAWSALEDVSVGTKSEVFLGLKSCVASDSPRLGKKVVWEETYENSFFP